MSLHDILMKRGQRNPHNLNVKDTLMQSLLTRLKQPSTIKGILALLSLAGIHLTDDVINAASEAILALLALWEVVRFEQQIPKGKVIEK
jgi:hypothetical protein